MEIKRGEKKTERWDSVGLDWGKEENENLVV